MNYKLMLKLLAPYLAVGVFWCVFKNGWLAIIAYHAQILLWAKRDGFRQFRFSKGSVLWLSFGSVVAAPALYFLAPK